MTKEQTTKSAETIFKKIKETLSTARKTNKEKGYTDILNWNRRRQQVDIAVWTNDTWVNGRRTTESYDIAVNDKKMVNLTSVSDVAEVFSTLIKMLNEQKKVKGWGGLNIVTDKQNLTDVSWSWDSSRYATTIVTKVCLADADCKEWKSLANYINKYGKNSYGSSPKVDGYEFFSAQMGGKRGTLWDEYGERLFINNKAKKCERILKELRDNRGSRDTMLCERGEENYIDDAERRHSEYYEVECEGEKRKYLKVTIKTPQGKVKYTTKIY